MASPHYDGEIPFHLAMTADLVRGWSDVLIQGHDEAAAQADAILAPGNATGIINPVPLHVTPAVVYIASTDQLADDATGTGANSVLVTGLDTNGLLQTETISMHATDGRIAVAGSKVFSAVNNLLVLTAGSGGRNVGTIWCGTGVFTLGVPAVGLGSIGPGENTGKFGVYTVPFGHEFFPQSAQMSGDGSSAFKGLTFEVDWYNPATQLEYELLDFHMGDGGTLNISDLHAPRLPAGSIVSFRGGCLAQTAHVTFRVTGFLHKLDRSIETRS
jgi:hypothetical protein